MEVSVHWGRSSETAYTTVTPTEVSTTSGRVARFSLAMTIAFGLSSFCSLYQGSWFTPRTFPLVEAIALEASGRAVFFVGFACANGDVKKWRRLSSWGTARAVLLRCLWSVAFPIVSTSAGCLFQLFSAAEGGHASILVPLLSLYVLMPIAFGIIWYRERPGRMKVVGILLTIASGLLIAFGSSASNVISEHYALFLATVTTLGATNIAKPLAARSLHPAFSRLFLILTYGTIAASMLAVSDFSVYEEGWMMAVVLAGSALLATADAFAFALYNSATERRAAERAV